MMYTFSIIIPHKNISTLLRRCLDSIPHRDDVQIIVVDDNSDAEKVDFTQFPGFGEINTEVYFTKEGKGAGYARNVGLCHAKGEWILFADSDDLFTDDIDTILNHCNESTADIIFFKACAKDTKTLEKVDSHHSAYIKRRNSFLESAKTVEDNIRYKIDAPWGKVYRRKFIETNGIRFEEVRYSNDVRFSAMCDFFAKDIEILDVEGYCYTVRPDSLWYDKSLFWAETRFGVALRMVQFAKKKKIHTQIKPYADSARYFLSEIRNFSRVSYLLHLIKFKLIVGFNN